MSYNLQFFAGETDDTDNTDDMSGLLDELTPNTDSTDEGVEEIIEEDPVEEVPEDTQQSKSQYAFAQMRAENKQLAALLTKVAQANGIDVSNQKDLIDKLNDDAIGKLAQKQNVPVELLKRIEQLENVEVQFKNNQLQQQTLVGLQRVMDDYGLTQEELNSFAEELDAAGKNPFTDSIDIVQEYKLMHYDDIMERKIQAAVQAALAKSDSADKHSASVSKKQGASQDPATEKINTVRGLTALLGDMEK